MPLALSSQPHASHLPLSVNIPAITILERASLDLTTALMALMATMTLLALMALMAMMEVIVMAEAMVSMATVKMGTMRKHMGTVVTRQSMVKDRKWHMDMRDTQMAMIVLTGQLTETSQVSTQATMVATTATTQETTQATMMATQATMVATQMSMEGTMKAMEIITETTMTALITATTAMAIKATKAIKTSLSKNKSDKTKTPTKTRISMAVQLTTYRQSPQSKHSSRRRKKPARIVSIWTPLITNASSSRSTLARLPTSSMLRSLQPMRPHPQAAGFRQRSTRRSSVFLKERSV